MPFDALLALGPAMARLLLRLTNSDKTDPADIVDDMVQLTSGIKGRADSRAVRRQLEDLADHVVAQVDHQLVVEFGALDENNVAAAAAAVALAVQDTAAGAGIETLVARGDADATKIVMLIRRCPRVQQWPQSLGADSTAAAHFILQEAVHHLVTMARRRPDFSLETLVEVARRSSLAIDLLTDMKSSLQDLPARVERTVNERSTERLKRQSENYTLEYRRALIAEYDRLEVYGLDLAWQVRRYSLTTGYVSLRLAGGGTAPSPHGRAQPFEELLPNRGAVIVEGAAGAGKTTLLQWLTVNAARESLHGRAAALNGSIPLFVRLRNYASSPLPEYRDLPRGSLSQQLLVTEPTNWLLDVRDDGSRKILVLVDGLDEFPEDRGEELADWCAGLTAALGENAITIFTTRPSAQAAMSAVRRSMRTPWKHLTILPMDRGEIRNFVHHWHTAVIRGEQFTRSGPLVLDSVRIADQLSREQRFRQLASSPLLCAAMCAILHIRTGFMPRNRTETYRTLIDMLLGREQRRSLLGPLAGLDEQQIRYVLEELAEHLLANGLSEIDRPRARENVKQSLSGMPELEPSIDAEAVLDSLTRRSGILRAPSQGVVDFVHRSMLEYLSARAMVRRDRIEALAMNAASPNWSESVVLSAPMANDSQLRRLVETLLRQAAGMEVPPPWLLEVAGGMLENSVVLPEEIRSQLVDVTEKALPPRSAAAARAIAAAGSSMFQRLVHALNGMDSVPPNVLATTIRSISDHGGPEALHALARLDRKLRRDGLEELLRIWPWFDLDEFARKILHDIEAEDDTEVVLNTVTVLPHLRQLPSGITFSASIEFPGDDLGRSLAGADLKRLTVKNLDLVDDPEIRAGQFLWSLNSAETVQVHRCIGLRRSSPGGGLRGTRDLSLNFASGVVELGALAGMRLRNLVLTGTGTLRTTLPGESIWADNLLVNGDFVVDPRGGTVDATSVVLAEASDEELLGLVATRALKKLSLVGSRISSLAKLENASQLHEIRLDNCDHLTDLQHLLRIQGLAMVEIAGRATRLPATQITALSHHVLSLVLEDENAATDTDDRAYTPAEWYDYTGQHQNWYSWETPDPRGSDPELGVAVQSLDDEDLGFLNAYGREPTDDDLRKIESQDRGGRRGIAGEARRGPGGGHPDDRRQP